MSFCRMTSESVLHLFCTPASRSFVRVVRVGAASRAVGTCDGVRGHGRRARPRPAYWPLPPFIFALSLPRVSYFYSDSQ